ncbi:MFS transporter [Paenibacillus koleovorans]|uniref:MFS transporter n=1 Tax=Paenibacillus koleovorans TaxID=121608 RepID=UPI0013E2D3F1|nr:MFS transporter [Paenibacillus koleovorans]
MKNVYWLALGAFLVATAELIVSGIVNVLAEDLGVTVAKAGQLVTAFSLGFAIGTPILVAFTARIHRKALLLAALTIFLAASLASALSNEYIYLLSARTFLGASAGLFCVIALGAIPKLVAGNRLGSAMGTIALAFSLSMVMGVPLGVAMSNWWGWESIFWAMGLGSLLVLAILKRNLPSIPGDAPQPFWSQFAVLRSWAVLGPLLLSMLWSSGNSVMLTYMAPLVEQQLQLKPDAVGWVLLGLGIIGIAGSKLGGLAVDWLGSRRMLLSSLAASAIALTAFPLTADLSPAVGLGLIGLWGFSMFMTAPAINAYFVQAAPRSINLVLGLNTSFTHLGLAAGASAGGVLLAWSDSVAYHPWLAGLFILAGLGSGVLSFGYRRAVARSASEK